MSVTSATDSTLFRTSVDRDKRISLFAVSGGEILLGVHKGDVVAISVTLTADEAREIARSFTLAADEADEIALIQSIQASK
jgi:ArsR family metal-binding transcriptional regulator